MTPQKVTAKTIRIWIRNCKTDYILKDIRRTLNRRIIILDNLKSSNPFKNLPIKKKMDICYRVGLLK